MASVKDWRFWVGILISAVFLYFALTGLHLDNFWQALQQANYWWLLPGIAVYFVGVWIRAWRWHYMLRPLKKISTGAMFPIVCIGYMGNNIFPARAGEVLRSAMLRQREGVPISASLATVIVERIFDGVVMLAFVFINLPELARLTANTGNLQGFDVSAVAIWGAVAFFGALVVFILAAMFPKVTEGIVDFVVKRFVPDRLKDKVRDLSMRFLSGLESLRSPVEVLMIFFTTVLIWLMETAKYWFVMYAFHFEVSFFTLMLINGVVNLMTTIPSGPGYVGTFDWPAIVILGAYGIAQEVAAGYTLVLHVALWLPITLLGAYYYLRQPLRWGSQLQKLTAEPERTV